MKLKTVRTETKYRPLIQVSSHKCIQIPRSLLGTSNLVEPNDNVVIDSNSGSGRADDDEDASMNHQSGIFS